MAFAGTVVLDCCAFDDITEFGVAFRLAIASDCCAFVDIIGLWRRVSRQCWAAKRLALAFGYVALRLAIIAFDDSIGLLLCVW